MDIQTVRSKSSEDLMKEILSLREEQFKLRMQKGLNQLSNPSRIRSLRKDIARIKTVLTEKGF